MVKVDLDHVYKMYKGNDKYSVSDFNLHIDDQEFIVFVGPSGCGKSTTLRMIAGLEDITKGVALGRAIVRDAPIFLMDEPLSNLDAKLRVTMRAEIAKLHQQLKTTTIYVTHDQTEAMTLADRIVVIKDGVQQQVGTPMEVYNKPANIFVAGFIGSPAMNFFHVILKDGKIIDKDHHDFEIPVPEGKLKILRDKGYEGKELVFGIRPEDVHTEEVFLESFPEQVVKAKVVVSELLGAETQLYCKVGNTDLVSKVDARDFTKPGAEVKMGFEMNKAHFFDPETTKTLDN